METGVRGRDLRNILRWRKKRSRRSREKGRGNRKGGKKVKVEETSLKQYWWTCHQQVPCLELSPWSSWGSLWAPGLTSMRLWMNTVLWTQTGKSQKAKGRVSRPEAEQLWGQRGGRKAPAGKGPWRSSLLQSLVTKKEACSCPRWSGQKRHPKQQDWHPMAISRADRIPQFPDFVLASVFLYLTHT